MAGVKSVQECLQRWKLERLLVPHCCMISTYTVSKKGRGSAPATRQKARQLSGGISMQRSEEKNRNVIELKIEQVGGGVGGVDITPSRAVGGHDTPQQKRLAEEMWCLAKREAAGQLGCKNCPGHAKCQGAISKKLEEAALAYTPANPKAAPVAIPAIVLELNTVSKQYPMTIFYFTGPELAIGWLVARFTSKIRQPANLGMAPVLANMFPVLTTIKVSALLGMIDPPPELKQAASNMQESLRQRQEGMIAAGGAQQKVAEAAGKAANMANHAGDLAVQGFNKIQGPIDRYGLSYFIGSKLTTVATIAGFAGAMHCGVDVSAVMTWMGMSSSIQGGVEGVSCMAAAVIINTCLLPGHLLLSIKASPFVGKHAVRLEQQYYNWVRSMEEAAEAKHTAAVATTTSMQSAESGANLSPGSKQM